MIVVSKRQKEFLSVGEQIGDLKVIGFSHRNENREFFYNCKCICGKIKPIKISCLLRTRRGLPGKTKSCGCMTSKYTGDAKTIHGMNGSKEYFTWQKMKYRCKNSKGMDYKNYSSRGIKVCPQWVNSFETFFIDMGLAPTERHSLDRIDVNGDYTPENCRWATRSEQANNTRRNVKYEIDGELKTIREWCNVFGVDYKKAVKRKVKNNDIFYIMGITKKEGRDEWIIY